MNQLEINIKNLNQEVSTRKQQINEIISHIQFLENKSKILISLGKENEGILDNSVRGILTSEIKNDLKVKFNSDLENILKGNLFVMTYNLIEFTTISLLDLIHLELKKYEYSILSDNIKELVGLNFKESLKKHGKKELPKCIQDLISLSDIDKNFSYYSHELRKDENRYNFLSGNIVPKKIKELSNTYNFEAPVDDRNCKMDDVETITNTRNKLAHGNLSFSDVGSGYTITELETKINNAVNYIDKLSDQITEYIDNKKFLSFE